MQDLCEHFAHCVQVFGGTTAASRRLGIDERALRRFINGERPVSAGLLQDTAKALRILIAEATAAEGHIALALGSEPADPQLSASKRDAAPSQVERES
jgi:transcriptional regulator with XRE-family HTH domain